MKPYVAGERKTRPGVYYRYTNRGGSVDQGAMNGINAIVINASWGPAGKVISCDSSQSIKDTFGKGDGVDAAVMLKTAGATRIYIYRLPGGTAGTGKLGESTTITAKYPGARNLTVKVQKKPADEKIKQFLVIEGTTQLEAFDFKAGESDETAALKEVVKDSNYVTVTSSATGVVTEGEVSIVDGTDPEPTPEDYLKGFQALEPYNYNVLSTDSVDIKVSTVLSTYADEAEQSGKLFIGVVGAPTTVELATRMTQAKSFNSKKIVYFGSGWVTATGEAINGAKAVSYAAGKVSATPSNESIVHSVISGAVEPIEKLTNSQYEDAIKSGLLLLSSGPDGQVWFDSGINTLTTLSATEDEGWKKIKRTKVRYELFDRIDKVTAPLVGKVNCDPDGIAAVIQSGMGVISNMIAERKLLAGATMFEDPDNPHGGDSAWFLIQADDIDALEKIYLHYQFRYSQNV